MQLNARAEGSKSTDREDQQRTMRRTRNCAGLHKHLVLIGVSCITCTEAGRIRSILVAKTSVQPRIIPFSTPPTGLPSMSTVNHAFQQLWNEVKAGSPEATHKFCQDYGPKILRAIRRRLGPVSRQVADSQDFTQDVWTSFFRQIPAGLEFTNMSAIVKYLLKMADHKVIDELRRINDRQTLYSRVGDDKRPRCDMTTGSQVVMATERRQKLVQNMPEQYRPLIQMLSEGWTHQEIAVHIGVSIRTIRRLVESLRADIKK
jgi:RNA polymerase sigma factor (sigma-70 family)